MQFTGEECGLCTRAVTGRNRDEVTLINPEGNEEKRRVCTFCFALFNYLTGSESANVHVQEAFSTVLHAILRTRNANVRKGVVVSEYDENDVAQPAKQYNLVPAIAGALDKPISIPSSGTQGYVPDWVLNDPELVKFHGLSSTTDTFVQPAASLETVTAGTYTANVLQAGNFEECGACDKEARPGKKYCEDWAKHEKELDYKPGELDL